MQFPKRGGSRDRTLAGVINGMALRTMFACETEPAPHVGLCESGSLNINRSKTDAMICEILDVIMPSRSSGR